MFFSSSLNWGINDMWNYIHFGRTTEAFSICICCEMITAVSSVYIHHCTRLYFLLQWVHLRSIFIATFKYAIQYYQPHLPCYPLHPCNLFMLQLGVCTVWPAYPSSHPAMPCLWQPWICALHLSAWLGFFGFAFI